MKLKKGEVIMFWLTWQLAGVVLAVVILAAVLGLGLLAIGVAVEAIDVLRRVPLRTWRMINAPCPIDVVWVYR
jgi:hypothetical protein